MGRPVRPALQQCGRPEELRHKRLAVALAETVTASISDSATKNVRPRCRPPVTAPSCDSGTHDRADRAKNGFRPRHIVIARRSTGADRVALGRREPEMASHHGNLRTAVPAISPAGLRPR